jgi:hypothetical protein
MRESGPDSALIRSHVCPAAHDRGFLGFPSPTFQFMIRVVTHRGIAPEIVSLDNQISSMVQSLPTLSLMRAAMGRKDSDLCKVLDLFSDYRNSIYKFCLGTGGGIDSWTEGGKLDNVCSLTAPHSAIPNTPVEIQKPAPFNEMDFFQPRQGRFRRAP